jgi:MFS family permease
MYEGLPVLGLAFGVFVDVLFATFSTPFLPNYLLNAGYTNHDVGMVMAAFFNTSVFGYLFTLIAQVFLPVPTVASRFNILFVSALFVTASSLATVAWPVYPVFLVTRAVQGIGSAIVWTYALSLGNCDSCTQLRGSSDETSSAVLP